MRLADDPARSFGEVTRPLDKLAEYRQRADTRSGTADSALSYYSGVIGKVIQVYQQEFSHAEDAELAQASYPWSRCSRPPRWWRARTPSWPWPGRPET